MGPRTGTTNLASQGEPITCLSLLSMVQSLAVIIGLFLLIYMWYFALDTLFWAIYSYESNE